MKKLNPNELLVGFLVPFVACVYWIGWWSIPVCAATSITWALGGAYGHSIRVWGVPALLCGSVGLTHGGFFYLFPYLPMAGILSIGYGIPSMYPHDDGSALGALWLKFVQTVFPAESPYVQDALANFYTRGTIYLLFVLSSLLWFL